MFRDGRSGHGRPHDGAAFLARAAAAIAYPMSHHAGGFGERARERRATVDLLAAHGPERVRETPVRAPHRIPHKEVAMLSLTRFRIALCTVVLAACSPVAHRPTPSDVAGAPVEEKFLVNVDARGVALQGYDPVAFFVENHPVKGSASRQSAYRGAIYWFASAENQAAFEREPARYAPQFGGFCGYAASIDTISPIDVNYFQILDGRLVLQHNAKAWRLWNDDVAGNLRRADANWPGLVEDNGI
jgi:YHS domain-containing protein